MVNLGLKVNLVKEVNSGLPGILNVCMSLSAVPMLHNYDTLQVQPDQPKCQGFLSAKSRKVLIIDSVEVARSAYATLIGGSVEAVYTYSDFNSALEAREHKKKHGRPICGLIFSTWETIMLCKSRMRPKN